MARQKSEKSEFVSALGTAFEMVKLIAEEVYALGGSDNDLRRIIKDRKLRQQIAKLLVANLGEVYPLDVFGHSINDLVKQGNYGWSNSDINDGNFQADEMHQAEVILKHFDKDMSTEAVLKALDADGLRPATMSELLEFSSRYPELQKQFPIVALGSFWQGPGGRRCVGYLYYFGGPRELSLLWVGRDWRDASTIKNYSWHVGQFLLWSENKTITTPLLNIYKEFLLTKQKNIGSINLRLVILNSYLHFIGFKHSFELLTDNKNRLAALDPLQLQNFLDQPLKKNNPVGHRDKALLEILYTSGLKVSDLVSLKKNQVDFLSREIIMSKKHLALPPYALHYLEKYLNFRKDKSPWLFINFDRSKKAGEKPLSVRSVERIVEKYALALRPRLKITPQILRNTLAYNLKSQGVTGTGLKEALHFQTKVGAGNYLNRL